MRTLGKRTRDGSGHGLLLALVLLILMLAPIVAHAQGADSVQVHWTAPGDDGASGTATAYDLRYSESPIDEGNFAQSTPVPGVAAPLPAGTRQSLVVRGLTRGTTYYFAIRTVDDVGNWSVISNVLRWDWVLDASPPSAPQGLAASRTGTSVTVRWDPNGEPDLAGYRVYRATGANGPFTQISNGLVTESQFVDRDLPDAPSVWYEVTAVDASSNESAHSGRIAVELTGVSAAIAQVVVQDGYPNPSSMSAPVHVPIVVPDAGAAGVYLEILDSGNRTVRRIDLGVLGAGRQEVTWDGRNDAGHLCAPGIYRGCVVTGGTRQAVRIVRVP